METNGRDAVDIAEEIRRRFKLPNLGFGPSRKLSTLMALLVVVVIFYNLCFVYVGPTEFGIKQVKIGLDRGIQKEPYTTGLHIIIPVMQRMHYLPKDMQLLELTNFPKTASRHARRGRAAHRTD